MRTYIIYGSDNIGPIAIKERIEAKYYIIQDQIAIFYAEDGSRIIATVPADKYLIMEAV